MSLRSSERGLKYVRIVYIKRACNVAPFVGAWIEIRETYTTIPTVDVAPFVGAWIEIDKYTFHVALIAVAPFVGAWIEM